MKTLMNFIEMNTQSVYDETVTLKVDQFSELLNTIENTVIDSSVEVDKNISGLRFTKTQIKEVTFRNCTFMGSSFNDVEFIGCTFENCKFMFTSFNNVTVKGSNFSNSSFIGCEVSKLNFSVCGLDKATLTLIATHKLSMHFCHI